MGNPKLSLVIPLYDEEAGARAVAVGLYRALDAAAIDYELVLVDNGSRDRTGAIVDELSIENPRVRKVRVEVNRGFGYGILQGLAATRGAWVGYLGRGRQIAPHDRVRGVPPRVSPDCA